MSIAKTRAKSSAVFGMTSNDPKENMKKKAISFNNIYIKTYNLNSFFNFSNRNQYKLDIYLTK